MKILTIEQMRQIEDLCGKIGLPSNQLMDNAGKAVADEVKSITGNIKQRHMLILVGPGNNGGDGLVAARHLHDGGARVSLYIFGKREENDPNFVKVRERNISCIEAGESGLNELKALLPAVNTVIDAIFGTGKVRPMEGNLKEVLEELAEARKNNPSLRIIALDLPSGLDADTGTVDPSCLYADNTITLGFPKIGLFNMPGAERTGKMKVVDIGIPSYLADPIPIELVTSEWVRSVLPGRPNTANKGSFGKILVISGSINYIGAAYLACTGAIRSGAGLVTLATPKSLQPILASKLTEVTYLPLPETEPGIVAEQAAEVIKREKAAYDVMLIGCGLGQNQAVASFLNEVILATEEDTTPLVLDADALNILAAKTDWWQRLTGDAILTPHPGEMSRLAGITVNEVQSNRISIAQEMAVKWQKIIVLKGAYTVIANPDGQVKINPAVNAGMASAGTGDVLSGVIAGLLAQGSGSFEAAVCGTFIHAEAGEMVRKRLGDAGMIASDLLQVLPLVIKQIKEKID